MEFYQHHLETEALIISGTLAEPLEHYPEGEELDDLENIFETVQQTIQHTLLVVDNQYRIVGFTPGSGYESQVTIPITPEITDAIKGEMGADIRSGTDGKDHLFVAVGVKYEQQVLGYLILSRPMQPAYQQVYQQWFRLGLTTLPVIILVVLAGLWFSSTLSQPLLRLHQATLQMARGAFHTRIEPVYEDEIGQVSRAFNHMAVQIEGLMKTQRHFVSHAAHELRTPLMTLKLRVEALEDEQLPIEERKRYLHELHKEIHHLSLLVSSLLILARMDEEHPVTDLSAEEVMNLLHDAIRHWRIEARRCLLDFEATLPYDLPSLRVPAQEFRLVLDNILGNAVKYTPKGQVVFQVTHSNKQLKLQVTDTGIGFDAQQGEQLFQRFYRSDEARKLTEGSGLGLSIVQLVVERYGGRIEARSDGWNKGATFRVDLPCG